MKSGWVDRDAETIVAQGAKSGIDRDFALRLYTTRLLGRDPKLVLHGGGNTSLKQVMRDRLGEEAEVLRIKATGEQKHCGGGGAAFGGGGRRKFFGELSVEVGRKLFDGVLGVLKTGAGVLTVEFYGINFPAILNCGGKLGDFIVGEK